MYMYADTGTCFYAGNVEQSGSVYLDLRLMVYFIIKCFKYLKYMQVGNNKIIKPLINHFDV